MKLTRRRLLFCLTLCGLLGFTVEGCTRADRSSNYIHRRGGWADWEEPFGFLSVNPQRTYLSVGWRDSAVADDELFHVVRVDPALHVDLRGNPGITDAGLRTLSALHHSLNYIDVRGTSVTESGVREFKRNHRRCEVYW